MYLGIFEKRVFTVPGLVWQPDLKRAKVKLDLLTYIDMLLLVGNCTGVGIRHGIYQYVKANNKYIKDYEENKHSSYIKYWDNTGEYNGGYFLTMMFNMLKNYRIFTIIYHFCLKEWKFRKLKKLYQTCMIKKNMLFL